MASIIIHGRKTTEDIYSGYVNYSTGNYITVIKPIAKTEKEIRDERSKEINLREIKNRKRRF